ncbi:sodium:alanine symporter family protein [Cuneatibacter sp. NSJ-177]|uniref:alanine/glycine:cation symporter family protein n=1 Tax=Cuneatibacter sp. NSJ-177 TaxID=2931401 RepID=UPI001FD1BBD0|nr:sodium:alanine symporter family protein [Cuneatibacter sp. NSJ-177]MCJ7834475.1 sodium:alanine symporter family protein [Cuneatibacter sp. NSJ-177]
MLLLILAAGLYFTWVTGGFQLFHFPLWMRKTLGTCFKKKEGNGKDGAMSPWQALCTSLAATIGTGNIVGVATALAAGGPGTLFWMWISAFFGMMTAFAEKVLGHVYRKKKPDGSFLGGTMVTIERGLSSRPMGLIYAFLCILVSFGMGNMAQANSIAQALEGTWNISPMVTAPFLALLIWFCCKGGGKRIGAITGVLVPIMSLFYMGGAFLIIWHFHDQLGDALHLVLSDAFSWRAMTVGIARGVFSNEAGLGSSVIAHAQSTVKDPVEQGMWGILEVFLDTIVMCTVTGLVLLVSGVWNGGADGAAMTLSAFSTVFGGWGKSILAVSIFFFALSTLIGWSFFGLECVSYLCGEKGKGIYLALFFGMTVVGCLGELADIWRIADICNELLAIPNLLCLFLLRKQVISLTGTYLSDKLRKKH